MSPPPKSKALTRNSTRLTRYATLSEDDAEQALKEIVAVHGKLVDRRGSSSRFCEKSEREVLSKKRRNV
jgi:hypothetical protein